jgi:hypothetical protein
MTISYEFSPEPLRHIYCALIGTITDDKLFAGALIFENKLDFAFQPAPECFRRCHNGSPKPLSEQATAFTSG